MKSLENIQKVVIRPPSIEHKGDHGVEIAVIYVKESVATKHVLQSAIALIQTITILLDKDFEVPSGMERRGGEQNKSWILSGEGHEDTPFKVRLINDRWRREQIQAFQYILRALAILHSWQIEE